MRVLLFNFGTWLALKSGITEPIRVKNANSVWVCLTGYAGDVYKKQMDFYVTADQWPELKECTHILIAACIWENMDKRNNHVANLSVLSLDNSQFPDPCSRECPVAENPDPCQTATASNAK
jgi:hypothetical protein